MTYNILEQDVGLEPTTFSLATRHSTTELILHKNSQVSCILTFPLYDQTTVSYKEYSGTTGGIQTPIVRGRNPLPCSVRPQWYKTWCPMSDLNRPPIAYKAIALPDELMGQIKQDRLN